MMVLLNVTQNSRLTDRCKVSVATMTLIFFFNCIKKGAFGIPFGLLISSPCLLFFCSFSLFFSHKKRSSEKDRKYGATN